MNYITDLIMNPYVIGAVVYAIASRYVVPPVASALVADITAIWNKYFPAKTA